MNFKVRKYNALLLTGILFFIPLFLSAQNTKKSRILFLLDASSSMTYNWNAKYSRFEIASNILLKIIDSVYALNNEVEFAVRAYGTQFAAQDKNCTDTRLEVPFNIQNVAQINTRLKNIKPLGFSPIAYSLRQAADNELSDAKLYDYSIIFITDGGESCNGDVCNTFREFLEKKIRVKPYIIGLDKNEQLNRLYDCMGNFIKVSDSADIDKAVNLIIDANRPLLEKPKLLNLPPIFANPGIIKDTGEVVIKEPEVKLVRSGSIFPRLRMIPYRYRLKEKVILIPAYIIQVKADVVTIHMNLEDETPKVAIVKKTDIFPRSTAAKYKFKIPENKFPDGKASTFRNKDKAVLRFDFTVPPPPVVRETDVFPLIMAGKYKFKIPENKFPDGKVSMVRNKDKAVLRFDFTVPPPPVVRKTDVFPLIIAGKYKFAKPENALKLNASTRTGDKPKSATLRFEVDVPVVRVNNVMPLLKTQKYWVASTPVTFKNLKPAVYNKKQVAVLSFEIEEKKKPVLGPIRPDKFPMRYSYAYRLPQNPPRKPVKETAILRFESADAAVVKKKDTVAKIATPPGPEKIDTDYTVALENSEETKVQIYFAGRNGKKYPAATPEIVFKELGNNSVITSFRRTVSGNEPVPQRIAAGKYNVIVSGYNDLFIKNVTIVPNKLNKVTIPVTDGTLSFAYMGNRSRPVEYNAIVNRRFAAGATVLQKCVDKLPYEPGTYYVEINTLPASKFSIDMSFGAIYELQIPEPGSLQFSNTNAIGNIRLQYEHGEMFEVFYNMNLNGNVAAQTVVLQPGRYKVIYPAKPELPEMGTKTLDFIVRSNQTTTLELK